MKSAPFNLSDEEKRVLLHLRSHGPTGRTELAAALRVSNATVTKLSRSLISLGLVEAMESPDSQGRGRPATPLRIAAAGGYAVGATIHQGVFEIALVDYAGGIISLSREEIDPPDPYSFARLVDRRVYDLAIEHRLLGTRLLGVGVGIPGPALSRDGDRWSVVPNLPGWRDVPLRQIMDETLGLPVWLENDATASVLAEYYLGGLLTRCSTAIVFLLGHGIGAGIIDDGRLLKGEFGNAGDVGILYPGDRPRPTTLDLLSTLRDQGCDINSVADFEEQTRGYEHVIERWIDRASSQLEIAVDSGIAWFDPGAIVLASPLPEPLVKRLADRLSDGRLLWGPQRVAATIEVSTLGASATALGAALLPIHASVARG